MRLFRTDEPIIKELLEVDVYKLTMLAFITRYYPNLRVAFRFKNRTKGLDLREYIDEGALCDELGHVATLRFTEKDVAFMRGWKIFPEHFLRTLPSVQLAPLDPILWHRSRTGEMEISCEGLWSEVTLWETIVLSIVNELFARGYAKKYGLNECDLASQGNARISRKFEILHANPGITFAQFGLRRRFSGPWEEHVTRRLVSGVPECIAGVSNVRLARDLGLEALGTNAHELPMALCTLARHESDETARQSVYAMLERWQMLYGERLLVMLPDTFGTDAFLAELPRKYAVDWRGFRQDSGDPFAFGEKVIAFYKRQGVDPRDKLIIFSDGLTVEKIVKLYRQFKWRIQVTFGWGTDLTNDLGVPPLSLVMKLMSAAGRPAVKLSDNIAKATGDIGEVGEIRRIFRYSSHFNEQPIY
ncbi:MAG: nicotinate phosphoribosyltransferase [Patescibacteria group bacterium]